MFVDVVFDQFGQRLDFGIEPVDVVFYLRLHGRVGHLQPIALLGDRLNFDEAVALEAKNPKITLLISYPCFEFWLLLHFGFTRAPIVGAGAHSAGDRVVQSLRAKPGMKDYAKGSIEGLFVKLLPQLPDANRHAEKTLQEAQTDGEMNPSTPLHQLMQLLMALGQPVPVRA